MYIYWLSARCEIFIYKTMFALAVETLRPAQNTGQL
jgi:hypothetical protein